MGASGAAMLLSSSNLPPQTGLDIVPLMTTNTTPSPTVISTAGTLTGGSTAFNAFDNNFASGGYSFTSVTPPFDIIVDFGAGATKYAAKYSVTSGNPTSRMPTAWTFDVSNDGSSWTTVDTQTGQTFGSTFFKVTYNLAVIAGPFRYVRWHITAGGSGGVFEGCEFEVIY